MEENKLKKSLESELNELILTVSTIKTFVKASESLIYDYDEFQIGDIQNMYDELEKKVNELSTTTDKISDIVHELT
ncbi:MAG: hypothetical protein LUG16_05815 [Candidatus Gastranaerophilales bacterium]|nr:hypothetical protein [Candidatus Gastranaerophilales bacterium]